MRKTIIKEIIGSCTGMLTENLKSYRSGSLSDVADKVLKKKRNILNLTSKHSTPFYVFDEGELNEAADLFLSSFKKEVPSFKAYYALKINHHPLVLKAVMKKGFGLDVGSKREIDIALKLGCKDMIYFSPGKNISDLKHALKYPKIITINIDSEGELYRLVESANESKCKIKAGVRIHTDSHGDWKKYGIHINRLSDFWNEAKKHKNINLCGIHFHVSRNKNAASYESTIKELGDYLRKNLTEDDLQKIGYIDFGGGFEVQNSEGFYPKNTPEGRAISLLNGIAGKKTEFSAPYFILDCIGIEEYAKKIGRAIKIHLEPILPNASYYSEPGRFIANNSMHIVLSVVDVKDAGNIILNGGVNMVGWQRFEYEYFPLINLTNPANSEIKCNMWGSLCATWDTWGYYCYANRINHGDIVVVPNQGALTYSLAQSFIQEIPPVYKL